MTAFLVWMTIKASALLAIAFVVQAVIHRRASAATRHLVWTLSVAAVLLLPVLSLTLPQWPVMTLVGTAAARVDPGPEMVDVVADEPSAGGSLGPGTRGGDWQTPSVARWEGVLAGTYAAGMLIMLVNLTLQRRNARRLVREAHGARHTQMIRLLNECAASLGIRGHVDLLQSDEHTMPMAMGTWRPVILIPAVADTWPQGRARAVILHELAHVARYDCLTQTLAFLACTMYWFHPGVWWVAHRLRVERELACDDCVIGAGAEPREYAGHLLEIAYTLGGRAQMLAVSMARRQQLEGRMLAVLDRARNRSVPSLRMRVATTWLAAGLLFPLAATTTATVAAAPGNDSVRVTLQLPVRQQAAARQTAAPATQKTPVAQDGLPGTWEIRSTDTEGIVHLRLMERNSSSGANMPIERLEGLTSRMLTTTGGAVQFRLRRDAGTFAFEGVLRSGVGAGTFTFAPDANFPGELAKRGFAWPTPAEQYQLARHDVGYAFVDELDRQRYAKPPIPELVRAGQHGVSLGFLSEMGALGHRLGTLAPLITLRDHGVTPGYIRELGDLGYKGLSADALQRARDHGISADYVRAMREAGYVALPMEQLINARDHGVSAEFIRELQVLGHRNLPLDQVINVRDHGVSSAYVSEMSALGYKVPLNDLVRARDHGVTAEFVREMAALGYGGLPLDGLIRMRDHGVTPGYVKELRSLGYDRLSVDDVVMLRDDGLTADRIKAANARAGTRLPIDMLRSLSGRF
jgi:beta-lactamase regulating signal transducer with metallopeptidase domain